MVINHRDKSGKDTWQTPTYATQLLFPYFTDLMMQWIVWECCCGKRAITDELINFGLRVFSTDIIEGYDALKYEPPLKYDCIITNPPYSLKDELIARCYSLNKPFALLMPLTSLEGQKRQTYWKKYGIQLIIPNRRINYIDDTRKGKSTANFPSAWFCYGFNLAKDINFVDMGK